MNKLLAAAAGAILLSMASMTAPAAAMPMHGISADTAVNVQTVQHRRHRHVRPRKICRTERVVRRGPHGRPIVRHVRVCR